MHHRFHALMFGACLALASPAAAGAESPARWWKGNLHTHSFWSDGDDFAENIADWYKSQGYQFLSFTDHNSTQSGARWLNVGNASRREAVERCRARFGEDWLDQRTNGSTQQVRLKMLAEYRPLLEEPGRFLLLPAEEITDKHRVLPIHINAINLRSKLTPAGGTNVLDVIQRNVDAVLAQRRRTGVPMFPHLNHPNFGWAVTAEDLMRVRGTRFFEVYNGHPSVRNEGDTNHPSLERMWDIALAFRLTELDLGLLYGLAVDDAHAYHDWHRTNSNPGRGWVVVRAPALEPRPLITAMEAGDFYASSGVRLRDVRRDPRGLEVDIDTEPGVTYTTRFIGTRRGFDPASQPGPRPRTSPFAVSRVYSAEIGRVLAESDGPRARYEFRGDELYVRAKILSSKPKASPYAEGETEAAWVQPVVP